MPYAKRKTLCRVRRRRHPLLRWNCSMPYVKRKTPCNNRGSKPLITCAKHAFRIEVNQRRDAGKTQRLVITGSLLATAAGVAAAVLPPAEPQLDLSPQATDVISTPASLAARWMTSVVVMARMPCAPAFAKRVRADGLERVSLLSRYAQLRRDAVHVRGRTASAGPRCAATSNSALFSGYVSSVGYL